MARGACYFITDNPNEKGTDFDENFLDDAAKDELAGGYAEDLSEEDQNTFIKDLLDTFKAAGATVEGDAVTFSDDFRAKYFASRFARFQELAANMTLDEFAHNRRNSKRGLPVFEATRLLCDEHGEAVWLDDAFLPMDEFLREYAHSDKTFYVRRAVYMK